MKKINLVLLFIFSSTVFLFPQKTEIKTLRAYTAGDEISLPVITTDSGPLVVEFDVQSEFIPNLNILFRYCDKNWNPTTNIFLLNIGKNTVYYLDFETLPSTVEDARYHFRGQFPNSHDDVEFPFSGKWMFYVTESNDTSIVYGTGKFYVVYEDIPLSLTTKREQLEDKVYFPSDLARVFNVTANAIIPDELFPAFVDQLEIIENKKLYNPIIVDRSFNTNQRQFYWDGNRRFTFTARDIYPGNEYRQADLKNINVFNTKNVKAQFDGIEYSRFFKSAPRDLNGGSILTHYKDSYATYMNVTFSIRPPEEVIGNIFLVGAFNNWQILPEYEMENEGGIYSKTISLKRGIYDYQYVTADIINNVIKNENWVVLEGNNWETKNLYHIFLYYNDPNYGGYDRIIGYQKIESR